MSIDAHDRGLLLGDGLFETVLWTRGRLVLFEAHAERMARGCAVLGLPAPDAAELEAAAKSAVEAAGLVEARAAVRLTWTAGPGGRGLDRPEPVSPRLIATAAAAPVRREPARLATSTVRRNDGSPASRLKTLAYLDNVLARREARAAGGDEALMLNTRGELACAAVANLFWIEGGALITPALDCGVLDGVMRGQVLRAAVELGLETREARAGREALARAEGLFLTNSLIGVCEVGTLDGAAAPRSPVPGRLREALSDVV
jgi:branched-chain amino acid aminotransferase/4-amino-4-deoxychorismate lyase